MDVHSVHNTSCLYVHVWAQERGKEVNYACRCRVAQSTAKHLFSDFQTENTTHECDMAKNHCRRDLQTEGWTQQQKTSLQSICSLTSKLRTPLMSLTWQRTTVAETCKLKAERINKKTSLTKLGNKKLSSSATPSCIISMPLQPKFHGIGRRRWRGPMLHSHRHTRQQMKQRPQNVHKRHGCMTSTKHFAFRNSETCISVRLSSKQCHDMLDFKTKLNGTELNGTMIPVVFFCPLLMH